MKILLVHNYFHMVGGAETHFFDIARLLKQKGHEVIFFSMKDKKNFQTEFVRYFVSNLSPWKELTLSKKIKSLCRIFYSFEAKKKIRRLIEEQKPDIVHIHNIWHEISFSIIYEIRKYNIPIIMTLHDYMMICPNRKMLVDNKLCFECKGQRYYKIISKRCIVNSLPRSIAIMLSIYFNNVILKTYRLVDLFISPSLFLIQKFKEGDLFKDRTIVHLPYCIDVKSDMSMINVQDKTIVYFGRLDIEKGVDVLIEAVKDLNITLKIIGTGSLESYLKKKVIEERITNVYFKGFIPHDKIKEEISKALFTVVPSIWYENYPFSIIESFALGKPVVASRIGGIPELVKEDYTGLTFEPGNSEDLRAKILYLVNNKSKIRELGIHAYEWVRRELNKEKYYIALIDIYKIAVNKKNSF